MATGRIGVTPNLRTRWSKAPAGGTTSLSGLDDNSVSLVYDAGFEAVYRNGVLLSRGNDYTATNGTTITLIDATIAGDIIEVFANQAIPLTSTYTQAVADAKFINNSLVDAKGDIIAATAADTVARLAVGSNDQVLTVDSSTTTGLKWATPATPTSGATLITRTTFTGSSAVTVDNLFSATYENYLIRLQCLSSVGNVELRTQGRYGSTTHTAANYQFSWIGLNTSSATVRTDYNFDATYWFMGILAAGQTNEYYLNAYRKNGSDHLYISGQYQGRYNSYHMSGGGFIESNQTWGGLYIYPVSGTITGQISVYGLASA